MRCLPSLDGGTHVSAGSIATVYLPVSINLRIHRNEQDPSLHRHAGITGAAGDRNQFGYGINANVNDDGGNSVAVNGQWRAAYANLGASYTRASNSRQASVTANGGLVVHAGGITLANQLGDTIGLVEAKGAKGARLSNATSAWTAAASRWRPAWCLTA